VDLEDLDLVEVEGLLVDDVVGDPEACEPVGVDAPLDGREQLGVDLGLRGVGLRRGVQRGVDLGLVLSGALVGVDGRSPWVVVGAASRFLYYYCSALWPRSKDLSHIS
jgi:hypothetical protein